MSWRPYNYLTSILSIILFIGVLVFKSYFDLSSNSMYYLYIVLSISCIISSALGVIVNGMNIKSTLLDSSLVASLLMILMLVLQLIMGLYTIILFT